MTARMDATREALNHPARASLSAALAEVKKWETRLAELKEALEAAAATAESEDISEEEAVVFISQIARAALAPAGNTT